MEPRPEDISKLRAELLNSFNRDEMRILGEEFNFPFDLDIPEGPYRTQVFNMVQLLRSKGRLPELLECAKKARQAQKDLVDIASHLQEATNLTFELRQTLRQNLPPQSVPEDKVREFYRAAWPKDLPLRIESGQAFEAAIRLAGVSPDLGGTPAEKYPILPFVERVAFFWMENDPEAARALVEWSRRAASLFGVSMADADEIRKSARTSLPVARYLLIQFHPAGGKYRLEGHLWTASEKKPQPLDCDDKPRTALELPSAVAPLIKQALDIDVNCAVEFLAPLDLLNEPFDAWKVMLKKYASRLGALTPVVIRRYDRVLREDPQEQQRWETKWAQLKDIDRPPFHWIDNASADPNQVYERLILPGSPPCVALGFAPASMPVPEAIEAALSAGTPVLVWIRDPDAKAPAIRQEIENVLREMHGSLSLPGLIRRYRTKDPPPAHPNDFALFFDCPERLPPHPRQLGIELSS